MFFIIKYTGGVDILMSNGYIPCGSLIEVVASRNYGQQRFQQSPPGWNGPSGGGRDFQVQTHRLLCCSRYGIEDDGSRG